MAPLRPGWCDARSCLCMVMQLTLRAEHRSQPHQGHHRPDLAKIMREHTRYKVSAVAPSACIDPELSLSSACASLGVPRFLGSPTWPTITYGPRLTSSCCLPVPARSRPPHGAHRCTLLREVHASTWRTGGFARAALLEPRRRRHPGWRDAHAPNKSRRSPPLPRRALLPCSSASSGSSASSVGAAVRRVAVGHAHHAGGSAAGHHHRRSAAVRGAAVGRANVRCAAVRSAGAGAPILLDLM